jgi:hypothetical protein
MEPEVSSLPIIEEEDPSDPLGVTMAFFEVPSFLVYSQPYK